MANTSKELNYAGQSIVVDSIKVLGNIDNQQVREISTRVRAMQQMQDSYNTQQRNYWSALVADNKITPAEKKTLLKEWETIQDTFTKLEEEAIVRGIEDTSFFNTYETYYNNLDTLLNTTLKLFSNLEQITTIPNREAFNEAYSNYYSFENYCQMSLADAKTENYWTQITADNMISPVEKKSILQNIKQITGRFNGFKNQAQDKGFLGTTWWNQFEQDYDALYEYLYTTLALFDDMEETTIIEDRETINQLFDTYNQEESFISVTLNTSIMGTLGFRILESLSEPGTEGEVGLYHGQIYQYVVSEGSGMWTPVGAEGYAGVMHEIPSLSIEGQYFLCDQNFTRTLPLNVNIIVSDNEEVRELLVNGNTLCVDYEFESGFIYIYQQGVWVKLVDQTNSKYLQVMLEYWNITGELPPVFQNVMIQAAQEEVTRQINNIHIPHYIGSSDLSVPAQQAYEGDWYLYTGTTTGSRINSIIYVFLNEVWTPTDPTDTSQGEKYMAALSDILKENNASPGYFSALFCAALYANSVFTNLLNSSSIILRNWTDAQGVVHHGSIEGNYNPTQGTGFRIDNSGAAVFNQGTFKGDVTANSFTLGASATVPGNKVSGTVANATNATNLGEGYISNVKMDHNSSGIALSTTNWNPNNPNTGFAIYKNGNCYFNNGRFRGEVNATSGTFTGEVDAQVFTLRVNAGSNIGGFIQAWGNDSRPVYLAPISKKVNFPAHGTVNMYVRICHAGGDGSSSNTFRVKLRGSTIGTYSVPNDGVLRSYTISNVTVNTGDEIIIESSENYDGGKRTYIKLEFGVTSINYFLKMLLESNNIEPVD